MTKDKYYFSSVPDGVVYILIMVIPFVVSFIENLTANNLNGIRLVLIFAILSSGYAIAKILNNEEYKGYRSILIPLYLAFFTLVASLILTVVSFAQYPSPTAPSLPTLDSIALYCYFAHLVLLAIEIGRIICSNLSKDSNISGGPLGVASEV